MLETDAKFTNNFHYTVKKLVFTIRNSISQSVRGRIKQSA
jgi:hypothetical protein